MLVFVNISQSQYSEKFIELSSKLTPVDSTSYESHFNNGKLKEKGQYYSYETDKYTYEIPYGLWKGFYRSGEVYAIMHYDDFGHIKSWKVFSKEGALTSETHVVSITFKNGNVDQFLSDWKFFDKKFYEKQYDYSFDVCKWYLKKEGAMMNNKKVGIWKTYHEDGTVKKQKEY